MDAAAGPAEEALILTRPAVTVAVAADVLMIWNLHSDWHSIICLEYTRYIPSIFQELTFSRYITGINFYDKSYIFNGFKACISPSQACIAGEHCNIECC